MKISDGFSGQRYMVMPHDVTDAVKTDVITKRLYVTSIGHFPVARFHYVNRLYGVEDYILIYCMEGSGTVCIDDDTFALSSHQYVVIPKGARHCYQSDDASPWTIYWVHFNGTMAGELCREMYVPQSASITADSRIAERNRLFDELYDTLCGSLEMSRLRYSSLLFMHYLATFSYIDIYRSSPNRQSSTHSDAITRKVIHYLNEQVEKKIGIDDIVKHCGYSHSYIYRKFIKEVGESPMDYFLRLKINHACFLLTHTGLTVTQISKKLSYSESQYFARSFKKIMGLSATDYRAKHMLGPQDGRAIPDKTPPGK